MGLLLRNRFFRLRRFTDRIVRRPLYVMLFVAKVKGGFYIGLGFLGLGISA